MSDKFQASAPPLGKQIRDLRLFRGLTLQGLAERAGTSAPTIHRYEGGWDRFEVATLRKIAAALDARLLIRLVPIGGIERSRSVTTDELIELLSPLFREKQLTVADLEHYPDWVLRRVLMFGDRAQAAAARAYFGDEAILTCVRHRGVDARTRRYWQTVLEEEPDAPESPQL